MMCVHQMCVSRLSELGVCEHAVILLRVWECTVCLLACYLSVYEELGCLSICPVVTRAAKIQ